MFAQNPSGIDGPDLKGRVARRDLLLAALAAGLAGFVLPVRAQPAEAFGSLGAVLDTLLPADALSPAATALGVDREVEDSILGNPTMARFFEAALGWLDQLDGAPFRDLPEARRVEILAALAEADFNQIPGRFYHLMRALAIEFYFTHPEAFAGYPLEPAPQPMGYPPPWS